MANVSGNKLPAGVSHIGLVEQVEFKNTKNGYENDTIEQSVRLATHHSGGTFQRNFRFCIGPDRCALGIHSQSGAGTKRLYPAQSGFGHSGPRGRHGYQFGQSLGDFIQRQQPLLDFGQRLRPFHALQQHRRGPGAGRHHPPARRTSRPGNSHWHHRQFGRGLFRHRHRQGEFHLLHRGRHHLRLEQRQRGRAQSGLLHVERGLQRTGRRLSGNQQLPLRGGFS